MKNPDKFIYKFMHQPEKIETREYIGNRIKEIFSHLDYLRAQAADEWNKERFKKRPDQEKTEKLRVKLEVVKNAKKDFLNGKWKNKDLLRLVREDTKRMQEIKEEAKKGLVSDQDIRKFEQEHAPEFEKEAAKQFEWENLLKASSPSPPEIQSLLYKKDES